MNSFTLSADWGDSVIDIRDIFERVEHLESEIVMWEDDPTYLTRDEAEDAQDELTILSDFLEELADNGGDEQWRTSWYPLTLVNDDYFTEYAQELAEETGAVDTNAVWPHTCIDWDRAARELQTDYMSVDLPDEHGNKATYWYR